MEEAPSTHMVVEGTRNRTILPNLIIYLFLDRVLLHVSQVDLKLMILLLQSLKCWMTNSVTLTNSRKDG